MSTYSHLCLLIHSQGGIPMPPCFLFSQGIIECDALHRYPVRIG